MSALRGFIMLFALCLGTAHCGIAQDIPAVLPPLNYSGFGLPDVRGTLTYALTTSELLTRGYNGSTDNVSYTSFSGDLAYLSISRSHPFSLVYAGGYNYSTSDQPSAAFHSLALSQVWAAGRWNFVAADSTRYLPQTPTTGLSGVPGQGDLGVSPIDVGPEYGQGVLNNYGSQISNTVSGTISRQLTGANSLSGSGTWSLQRFIENTAYEGIDNNQDTGAAVFAHRINPLSSASVIYSYNKSVFPAESFSIASQTINLEYSRQWTRKIFTDISVGPQRTTGNFGSIYNLATNASITYTANKSSITAAYIRTSNSGSGVTTGAESDSLAANANRRLGSVWESAAIFTFVRTSSLPTLGTTDFFSKTIVGSGQLSRQLGQKLSVYGSYSVQRQLLSNGVVQAGVFSGFSQFIGVGLTYSPHALKFGR